MTAPEAVITSSELVIVVRAPGSFVSLRRNGLLTRPTARLERSVILALPTTGTSTNMSDPMAVRWSREQLAARVGRDAMAGFDLAREELKAGRYGNVTKPTVDNIKFDSGREMQRYLDLKLMQKAGVIRDLELQPRFPIVIGGVKVMALSKRFHLNGRQVVYVADFRYYDIERDQEVIEDVKMESGHLPREYILKRAMVHAMGIKITEI